MNTEQIFSDLEAELAAFISRRTPAYLQDVISGGCYVYGAGSYGRRILALLKERDIPCHGIIDRRFGLEGAEINGTPALNPAALREVDTAGKCLLIGVHNQAVAPAEIIAFGRAYAFREILWNADLPDALGPDADNYWLTARQFTMEHFTEIRTASRFLADEESVAVLAAQIRYRITGDPADYPPADITQQYMPDGLLNFPEPICFIDGDAYTGDTYSYLLSRNVVVKNWIAFEPDPENFAKLTAFAATLSTASTLFPCGLSETFMQVQFAANEGAASHLGTGSGEMTVPCVALDDAIHGFCPDYIKLDIEGAEHSALLGMRKTIAAARPHLAVSAYHRPEDLWALAQIISELAPYAKLHLRQHAFNAFDTVYYAVPQDGTTHSRVS